MWQFITAHSTAFILGAYWLFSAIVSGMPDPAAGSSTAYVWIYRSLHTLAGNLSNAVAAKVPSPQPPAQKGSARMGSVFGSAGLLVGILMLAGCLTASQFTQYLNAVAPAVSIILQIVATARGVPYSPAPAAKISGDVASVEKVYSDWQAAKAADKPGILATVNSSFQVLQADLTQVFSVAQVSDQKVQGKVATLIGYVWDGVQLAESFVPQSQPVAARQAAVANLKAKQLKSSFNGVLHARTGNAAVDQVASKLKL